MRGLFIVSLLCISFSIIAQDTTKSNVITYAPFSTKTVDPQKDIKIDKNCIKWNIGILSRGVFLFNYERVISEHFSIEAGVGATYQDYFYGLNSDLETTGSSLFNDNSNTKNQQVIKPGFAIELSPRIYPRDGYMEGFYFAPIFRFRKYNYMYDSPQFYNDSTNMYQTIKGSQNLGHTSTEYGFLIGYQTDQSYWYDMTWDYYFGVSYRTNSYKDLSYNGTSLTLINKQNTIPTILFGIKVGLFQF